MISVCMATYNGERFLREQIDSILCQLNPDDELIISDDGSTDGTLEIITSYQDSRIKLLKHDQSKELLSMQLGTFREVTQNFQNALNYANGSIIFFADQDDIWEDDKVRVFVSELESVDIVMSNFSVIDESGNVLKQQFYKKNPIANNLYVNILKSQFIGCCLAFKRNVLEYILPFPNALLAHDYWTGCLGCHKFKFKYINQPLHKYRRYGQNVSPSTGKSKNTIATKIKYRYEFLLQIHKHIRIKTND